MRELINLLASYNEWMNTKIYAAAGELPQEELSANKGAFFGSVLGTLNHIMVGDRIWLRRFADHPSRPGALDLVRELPQPRALNEILFSDFTQLAEHRRMLDDVIKRWAQSLTDADLEVVLRYKTTRGDERANPFSGVVLHFFNHQTHHRGQVTTLLSQMGKDVGATDLLMLVKNERPAAE